jgi:hypothetical protein
MLMLCETGSQRRGHWQEVSQASAQLHWIFRKIKIIIEEIRKRRKYTKN